MAGLSMPGCSEGTPTHLAIWRGQQLPLEHKAMLPAAGEQEPVRQQLLPAKVAQRVLSQQLGDIHTASCVLKPAAGAHAPEHAQPNVHWAAAPLARPARSSQLVAQLGVAVEDAGLVQHHAPAALSTARSAGGRICG
jgi:hypothetical protein